MEGAIRAGLESLALYRTVEARQEAALLENNLAMAYLRVGNLPRAADYAAGARRCTRRTTTVARWHMCSRREAQIALAAGDATGALELAGQAMEHASAVDDQKALTSSLLTIARAHAAAGNTEAALAAYARTVDALRQTGPAPVSEHALTDWADLLARLGRHREAFDLDPRSAAGDKPRHLTLRPPYRVRLASLLECHL